jgi:DnaJ-domain-containing protein 1
VRQFDLFDRGDFVRVAYRLGRARATGLLTVAPPRGRTELLVLRRGYLMAPEIDPLGRAAARRLAHIASMTGARCHFDGGTAAYPPGATARQFSLAGWARSHLEAQVDAGRARALLEELAGVRLGVRPELSPDPDSCDATDRRILAAMSAPRRLDQIWPLARTPRFRLLTFIHFLRGVGALCESGVAATAARPAQPDTTATPAVGDALDPHRLLGVHVGTDPETLKRAYRRLARALHPDLHPGAPVERRRRLEQRLAAVTSAYHRLRAV